MLAGDLSERIELEAQADELNRKEYETTKWHNPANVYDSDCSEPEPNSAKELSNKKQEVRKMKRNQRIADVVNSVLSNTEIEYLVGQLRRNIR